MDLTGRQLRTGIRVRLLWVGNFGWIQAAVLIATRSVVAELASREGWLIMPPGAWLPEPDGGLEVSTVTTNASQHRERPFKRGWSTP